MTLIYTGECYSNLVHELSDNSSEPIVEVLISPQGRYVITRTANTDVPKNQRNWSKLHHDILWDAEKQNVVYQVSRISLFAVITKNSTMQLSSIFHHFIIMKK